MRVSFLFFIEISGGFIWESYPNAEILSYTRSQALVNNQGCVLP